jgi:hypothetical protein
MPVIRIDPNDKYPRLYWPEELKRYGYSGDVELLCDPFTGVILHPKATPEQIIRSLENRIRDIQLRRENRGTLFRPLEKKTAQPPSVEAPAAEWENMQCPYPDCRAALMWHVSWDRATCSRCGRAIVRYSSESR